MRFFDTHRLCLAATLLLSSFSPAAEYTSTEFKPRGSGTRTSDQLLFTEVKTSVDIINSYDDPRMWAERYQEMVFGTIGTGVAVADFDKDGMPDVFLSVKTGGSRLYRNLGDWKFEDVTESAGLHPKEESWSGKLKGLFGSDSDQNIPWDQAAAFADVDNDGWLDLYVTSFNAPNRLYMNQGDGTFLEQADSRGLAIQDACGSAAFCDYDRDGWLDLYLQTNMLDVVSEPEGRPDRLLRNRGDGTFEDVTAAAGISGYSSGHSVAWWDHDQDGWPDLYVANDFSVPDKLYRNNGDGTFSDVLESTLPLTPYYSMGSDLGDVNNDGLIDLFVGDMAPTSHEKDQRGMAVSRARELANRPSEIAPQRMRNALYLNTGTSRMKEAAWMYGVARSDWTWSTRFEDFDNDGWLDLYVTNGMIREYHNADILKSVMGAVSRQAQRAVMKRSPVMAESNLAFRNTQGNGFERIERSWGLDFKGVSFGVATGDFDGDGDLDLVQANYNAPFTFYRNNSEGNRVVFAFEGERSNRYGIGATIEIRTVSGKQIREIVNARGYLSTSEPIAHFGLGGEETIETVIIRWPSGVVQTLENLSANRRYVVREPSRASGSVIAASNAASTKSLFRKGEGVVPSSARLVHAQAVARDAIPPSALRFPESVVAYSSDFNGDDKPDYAIGSIGLNTRYQASPESPFVVFEGNFGRPGETQRIEAYYEDGRLLPFRSRKELVALIPPLERKVSSANVYAAATLEEIVGPVALSKAKRQEITELRSGLLLSTTNDEYTFHPFPWSAQIAPFTDFAFADFDGDGTLDIAAAQNDHEVDPVVGYHDGGLGVILLGDGEGHFEALSPIESGLILPGADWNLSAQDIDNDGDIDLIATRPGDSPQLFLNQTRQ